jgi:hypothetical protein
MHKVIMGMPPRGLVVDHRNGDGLDNRRSNLRFSTRAGNARNRRHHRSWRGRECASRFKGITWDKEARKWCAAIYVDGKRKNLGRFHSEMEAAKAYDRAALAEFGEFARLNFNPDSLSNVNQSTFDMGDEEEC